MKKLNVAETKLEKDVQRIINRESDGNLEGYLNDLSNGGCQSGMVCALIYYKDTTKFYQKHKTEISQLLANIDAPLEDIFGEKWDRKDTLVLDTQNQNLLAWYAFEDVAYELGRKAGLDI